MSERTGLVTLKGNPITLVGDELKAGDKAPDFQLTGTDMSSKSLSDYEGKVKLVVVVPSLDTSVCDTEVRKFNEHATSLGDDIIVLTVSMDLPPAQKRWCGAAGVDRVECLSDYKDHSFGKAWGLRIKEIGFLARSIFVLDKDNTVRYMELVPEIGQEPDYDAALAAAKQLV
ncbi:thiol peroxidase [Phycisphaerales bacterium AB-hyl4]|uniref:Thiol peroxidase n=1 Tax=Natronomicrosphaera hydrolytica TaxID=3242702 RepID=A0ABV4U9G8_9BACT